MGVGGRGLFQRTGNCSNDEVLVLGTQLVLSPRADEFTLVITANSSDGERKRGG